MVLLVELVEVLVGVLAVELLMLLPFKQGLLLLVVLPCMGLELYLE